MARLPEGTITFMLTDLQGSTHIWESQPQAMRVAMARHDEIMAGAVGGNAGEMVEAGREGDSISAVFKTAASAAACALNIQSDFAAASWPDGLVLKVRIALNTGEAELRDGHYYGSALNRCARLLAICHPGQVLLTQATGAMLADELPQGTALKDLGLHHLKDLVRPEQVFQLDSLAHPTEFPPLVSAAEPLTNLPIELSSFVGRTHELEQLRNLQSRSRLLSLVGPGGVGKTRLAVQLAADVQAKFGDGAWMVELAPIRDGGLVPQAVAAALGLPEQANSPLATTLVEHLRERETLLVMDNCEHLIEATAPLTEMLLRSCPKLSVLVTSREALNVTGEVTWWVPPLGEADAVQLFMDRARSTEHAQPDEGAPVVAHICRRLDGLPLAIELAAARTRMMPIEEIEARLSDRFHLLTGGSRTADERQRTLEKAVDWSYDQLGEPERLLFSRLAVFVGRFALTDAESVCSAPPLTRADVLELLGRLVDKSMLVADEGRYRLLETMREYGRQRFAESGQGQELSLQHARHFLEVARSWEPGQFAEWLDRVEEADDNFRAAVAWTVTHDPALGTQLAGALNEFWQLRGHNTEARIWLESLLAAAEEGSPPRTAARIQLAAFVYTQNELEAAERLLEDGLAAARSDGNRFQEMLALKVLALVRLAMGNIDQAGSAAEEALSLALALGERWHESLINQHLGLIRASLGDIQGARERLANSVAIRRSLGRGDEVSTTLGLLAVIANLQGDHKAADEAILDSLHTGNDLKDRRLGWTLDVLASRLAVDRPEEAQRVAGAASAMYASVGIMPPAVWQSAITAALGPARRSLGEDRAKKAWEQGMRMGFEEAVAYALAQAEQ